MGKILKYIGCALLAAVIIAILGIILFGSYKLCLWFYGLFGITMKNLTFGKYILLELGDIAVTLIILFAIFSKN